MKHNNFFKQMLAFVALLLAGGALMANNLQITNVSISERNDVEKWCTIKFTLSWENSFRNTENWDAAWIFVKYRKYGDISNFNHATLSDAANHSVPSGFQITQPSDNKGFFVYRDAVGNGTATLDSVKVRWNYGADNADVTSNMDLKVFGIEMVYVPQGEFWVGDGSPMQANWVNSGGGASVLSYWPFTKSETYNQANTLPLPYKITSENAIPYSTVAGGLYTHNGGYAYQSSLSNIPAQFPKGYNAFYCMKTELTQKGYCDFLNTLNRTIQVALCSTPSDIPNGGGAIAGAYRFVMVRSTAPSGRNNICLPPTVPAAPVPLTFYCDQDNDNVYNETIDGLTLPANYIQQSAMELYLNWACLRVMTEFEYEKACRGPVYPVQYEMAWGSPYTQVNTGWNSFNNMNTDSEAPPASDSITNFSNHINRVGALAARANATRLNSGATYWGILNMSDNGYEPVWSVYTDGMRNNVTNVCGNGIVHPTNIGPSGTAFYAGYYPSMRGGYVGTAYTVSDRHFATSTYENFATANAIRGVRQP